MRILLSCVPYDGGKSGISVCMREQVAALKAAGHSPTLIVEHDAAGDFPDDRKILLPAWTRRPLFSMLYHLFILPFRIRRRDFDFCLICAANRRALAFYPLPRLRWFTIFPSIMSRQNTMRSACFTSGMSCRFLSAVRQLRRRSVIPRRRICKHSGKSPKGESG